MMPSFGEICSACGSFGCLYLLLAIGVTLLAKRARGGLARPEPVTILKPLHGSEPGLAECLGSFCQQGYPAPIQLVFAAADAGDTALVAAREVKVKFPALPAVIVAGGTVHGTNAKISNLINMERYAAHDILIAADSDILVGPDFIALIVELLQKPGVGAVSVLYHGVPASGLWSRLSANGINTHFLPNVLVGMALKLAKPCFGSAIALRRETLEAIGGFRAFANRLADDYAIGEAVSNTGQTVEIALSSVAHVCSEESAGELAAHQIRWARTIRSIEPVGYLGSFITHPFAIASLGIVAGDGSCVGIAAVALCLRLVLCKTVERAFQTGWQDYWLVPITDWLAFGVYVWSFFGSAVTWKSSEYSLLPDGTLARNRRE
jgi:ceramide glucosyltransferase